MYNFYYVELIDRETGEPYGSLVSSVDPSIVQDLIIEYKTTLKENEYFDVDYFTEWVQDNKDEISMTRFTFDDVLVI